MKKIYPLKCCPWCGCTPKFFMFTPLDETWTPRIECKNHYCRVMPKTKFVPIRKKQRENAEILREKIERVIKFWNDGNLGFNNEGFELDYDKIVEDFKSGNIGLPGYGR